MKKRNAEQVLEILIRGSEWEIGSLNIFDMDHCSEFDCYPQLEALKENHWDMTKDLNKVLISDLCQENGIELEQICVIDNDEHKLQLCLDNTILADEYTEDDVLGLSERDDAWH